MYIKPKQNHIRFLILVFSCIQFWSVICCFGERVDMDERYETLKELGSGNFGVARLAKDKETGELVAIKYIERGKKVQCS